MEDSISFSPSLNPNAPPFQPPSSSCSWSKKLFSLGHIPDLQRLKYSPPVCKEDRVVTVCSKDEVARTEVRWKEAIQGFFADKKPFFPAMVAAMERSWKIKGSMEVLQRHDDSIIIIFGSIEERNRILEFGPWFILGRYLHLRLWSQYVRTRKEFFATMPVWIYLPNLPLHFWSPDSIEKSPPQSVVIEIEGGEEEPVIQSVEYEIVMKMCVSCHSFGHKEGECTKVGSLTSTLSSKKTKIPVNTKENNINSSKLRESTKPNSSGWIQVNGKSLKTSNRFEIPILLQTEEVTPITDHEVIQPVSERLQKEASDGPSVAEITQTDIFIEAVGNEKVEDTMATANEVVTVTVNQKKAISFSGDKQTDSEPGITGVVPATGTMIPNGLMQSPVEIYLADSDLTVLLDPKGRVGERPYLFVDVSRQQQFEPEVVGLESHKIVEPSSICDYAIIPPTSTLSGSKLVVTGSKLSCQSHSLVLSLDPLLARDGNRSKSGEIPAAMVDVRKTVGGALDESSGRSLVVDEDMHLSETNLNIERILQSRLVCPTWTFWLVSRIV